MKIIVLDLEMNQPSKKIIQIGAVEVQLPEGKITPFFSEIVNPGELPSAYISQLTGITTKDVKNARPLSEGLQEFWAKIQTLEKPYSLAAWGLDCPKIVKDSKKLGIKGIPKDLTSYDIRSICGIHTLLEGRKAKSRGLANVAKFYGIPLDNHHNAYEDALATAKIVVKCFAAIQDLGY